MSPDDPRHGTTAGAQQHWKDGEAACDPCTTAYRRRRKRRDLDALGGRPHMVELGEKAYRVVCAYTPTELQRATQIPRNKFSDWRHDGPHARVHRRTREAVEAAATLGLPTAIGMQRRLQALAVIGKPLSEIAPVIGVAQSSLGRLRRNRRPTFVRQSVAPLVIEYYEKHQMDPVPEPPNHSQTQTMRLAHKHNWLPPFAWDDIDLDPYPVRWHRSADEIDDAIVQRLVSGEHIRSTRAEKVEALRRWAASGGSERDLCRIHGWRPGRYAA